MTFDGTYELPPGRRVAGAWARPEREKPEPVIVEPWPSTWGPMPPLDPAEADLPNPFRGGTRGGAAPARGVL